MAVTGAERLIRPDSHVTAMDRRRFLALLGATGLAGCNAGRSSTPTLTPAPLPQDPTPTPADSAFADAPCPTLDGATACAHTQPADATVQVRVFPERVSSENALLVGLENRGDRPVEFTPKRWTLWARRGDVWQPAAGNSDGGLVRTLEPGEDHEWLVLLDNQVAYSRIDRSVVIVDLQPGRYALALPTADRTYVALFEVVGSEVRTPGNGSAV
jgi:hypothetical protein